MKMPCHNWNVSCAFDCDPTSRRRNELHLGAQDFSLPHRMIPPLASTDLPRARVAG